MDIKRLFQIPLIFLLIPLFFLVMLIKIYILQYIIMNRIAVWGGSFWMVLFLFCLPALEVLPVWKIIVYHYGWKVREKLISSSYSRGDILVLYQAIKRSNAVRAAWRWDSITIRCNDHLCVQGIRLVLYAIRYESSNRKNFL